MEMHSKIKELTEKIQREGLEKANSEAERIKQEAIAEAEKLLSDAKKESEKIRENAKKESEDFTERMRSEFKMSQQQALTNLKKEITDIIQTKTIGEPVKSGLEDKEFINKLLETLIKNWKDSHESMDLEILLPADQLEDTEKYLKKKMSDLMNNGLVVKEYPGIKGGFEIKPQSGHYKISMTDEAFEMFIKEYFKPKTVEFLFGGNEE
ncbi:MAG: hypothetical protein ACOCUP_01340 [bacterium]